MTAFGQHDRMNFTSVLLKLNIQVNENSKKILIPNASVVVENAIF